MEKIKTKLICHPEARRISLLEYTVWNLSDLDSSFVRMTNGSLDTTRNTLKPLTMKRLIYILVGFVLLTTSCKKGDWYDVKSNKNLAVPTTLKDMQALMDNARVMNTLTPGIGEISSDGHYINDARALTLTGYERNAYTWSHEQPNRIVPDWANAPASGSYSRIYYANLVLDEINKIKPGNNLEQSEWNNIKGQALFHRAHAFFELAQVFAPPFEATTANSKLGIPLRLESDINIPSKRSTVQQTYDQIINDSMSAKDLLPISPQYKTRPSRVALYAFLARVYLSMENYTEASKYSELCLDNYSSLMSYSTLNTAATTNPIIGYNPEIIFYTSMTGSDPISSSSILIERSLYDSYDVNDLRKKVFYNVNLTTNLVTYKGTYSGLGFPNCFSGLATDEIYLIRAECYARAGKVTEAMNDLNNLLKTRWSGIYTAITAANSEDALRKILDERKKELILRGLRWSDLRRLNRDPRFTVTLTRTVGGLTYTLEPNSYKYTFPIPDDVIELTGMEQNLGW